MNINTYQVTLNKLLFSDLISEILNKKTLKSKGEFKEIGSNHFFFRGYRRFDKPFIKRILSFNYWYLVVEIEYEENQLKTSSKWFDGNEEGPVDRQNHITEPKKEFKTKETEIIESIIALTENYNSN